MSHYVYIIESEADGSFYVGYSADAERRLIDHNDGRSRFTRRKTPWKLVYTELYLLKAEAIKRERFLKKQRNRSFYKRLIEQQ
jgi:putative endonuclease